MVGEDTNAGATGLVANPAQSIEEDAVVSSPKTAQALGEDQGVDGEIDASDNDAPGELDDDMVDAIDVGDGRVSNALYKQFKAITEVLLNHKIKGRGDEEHFPATLFKRLPNKRLLPDYYEVIKTPSAISTLRGKIQRKQYASVPEFVRDFALVVHNAQVYNRPNSQPVRDVLKLDGVFKEELQKLVDNGFATDGDVKYPDLGIIPYASPEPDPVSEEEEGEDEDDEEDDEAEDTDDEKRKKKTKRGPKSAAGRKGDEEDDDEKAADAEQKRRGRPPKVATPMEHRIDRILKTLRKTKAHDGAIMLSPFERLPDKAELPEYYQVITHPMAYDVLKKKAKRKKYHSMEDFMKDVELMFTNAMTFNEDGSDIHKWAQDLLQEARRSEAEERAKPDTEYLQAAEGRIPLASITYKGDTWKIGDWIHIQNPNDITKPIVAQIYRTWKTANDEEWINACWYYRPEQTVHQYEKHFYPNEVVKTGQYRDHKIEEVLNKCFVMFYTRYSRGRPRVLAPDAEVYVCEARYNEDKYKFNKIKTWASCLPDEVRDKDYEMDLFEAPRKIRKMPSPLLSRLNSDAKDTDELPQPEWKHSNAPPLVGGIYNRPRDENQSPPPEPTPPPQTLPQMAHRTPSMSMTDKTRIPMPSQAQSTVNLQSQNARPNMIGTPQPSYAANANQHPRQNSHTGVTQPYGGHTQPTPQLSSQQYQYTPQAQVQPPLAAAHPGNYMSSTPAPNYNRPLSSSVQPTAYPSQSVNSTPDHRSAEAFVLNSAANESIPKSVRDQFPQDDNGHMLFFTAPPLETRQTVSASAQDVNSTRLEHTESHTKALAVRKRKLQEPSVQPDGDLEMHDLQKDITAKHVNSISSNQVAIGVSPDSGHQLIRQGLLSGKELAKQNIYSEYQSKFGEDWRRFLLADLRWSEQRRGQELKLGHAAEARRQVLAASHLGKNNGQFAINQQGYITNWQKDFYTSTYLDDYDSRLP